MRVFKTAAVAATLMIFLAGCSTPGSAPDRAPSAPASEQMQQQTPADAALGQGEETGAPAGNSAPGPGLAAEQSLPPASEVLADFDTALVKLSGTYVAEVAPGWTGPIYPDQEEEFFAHLATLVEPAVKDGWRGAESGDKLAAVRAWVREYPATTYNPALMGYMWELTCVSVENAGEEGQLPASISDADPQSAVSLAIAYTCPALLTGP